MSIRGRFLPDGAADGSGAAPSPGTSCIVASVSTDVEPAG